MLSECIHENKLSYVLRKYKATAADLLHGIFLISIKSADMTAMSVC